MAKETGLWKTLSETSLGYHADLLLDVQASPQQGSWDMGDAFLGPDVSRLSVTSHHMVRHMD